MLLAFLALAILCYGIGFRLQAMLIVGLGIFFEGLFWLKLIRGSRRGAGSR